LGRWIYSRPRRTGGQLLLIAVGGAAAFCGATHPLHINSVDGADRDRLRAVLMAALLYLRA